MARTIGPVCKLCRREGEKLFLKGARCMSPKCAIERRGYAPGQHGKTSQFKRGRSTDYLNQLREKQKARRIYGVLEAQFRRYFTLALKGKGVTGAMLLTLLESRLDNIVYRIGFAPGRIAARMLVTHRHIEVNGRVVDIPSFILKPGDVIKVRDRSRKLSMIHDAMKRVKEGNLVPYLELDKAKMEGKFLSYPNREDIPIRAREQMVVELYSK